MFLAIAITAAVASLFVAAETPSLEKLLYSESAAEDYFGFGVAIDGDTAIVGAYKTDVEGVKDSGAAYVFTNKQGVWELQGVLAANDGKIDDTFGGFVAIKGDTAVVGAIRSDDEGSDSGAAYVFNRSETEWAFEQKIVAPDARKSESAQFGQTIALLDDMLIIGAPRDDQKGTDTGAVYVYIKKKSGWQFHEKLTASDATAGDLFGISLAVDGETLIVGADLNDESAENGGAAYVFYWRDNRWKQSDKLVANDAGETDLFGVRVAISGNTALISARRDDDPITGVDSGSVYVFEITTDGWQQRAKLTAPDAAADDRFGRAVALHKDTAIITAMHDDDKGENSGSAYVFKRLGDKWVFDSKILPEDGVKDDRFGWSVAISNNTAIFGTPDYSREKAHSGAAYVLTLPQLKLILRDLKL
ncbi:MAG: FG-GAP repeat protein [Pseudomonadota bacterium]